MIRDSIRAYPAAARIELRVGRDWKDDRRKGNRARYGQAETEATTNHSRLLFGSSTDVTARERRFSLGALRRRLLAGLRLSEAPGSAELGA